MSLVDIDFERLKSLYIYICYKNSSMIYARINLNPLINAAIGILGYIPVIKQAWLLISFGISSGRFSDFSTISPHYIKLLIIQPQYEFVIPMPEVVCRSYLIF